MFKKVKLEKYHIVTMVSWISRFFQIIAQLIIITLLTRYLKIDEYAVFALISSLLTWYMLADFGIGSSIQNIISELRAKNEDITKYIGSAIFILIAIYILFSAILLLFAGLFTEVLLGQFTNIHNKNNIFIISSILMLTQSLSSIIYRIWYALEKGYLSQILPAIASIISLFIIYKIGIIYANDEKLLLYSLIGFFLPSSCLPLIYIIKFALQNNLFWQKEKVVFLLNRSYGFFFTSLITAITLQLDFIIILKVINSNSDFIVYHTLSRIFSVSFFVYSALLFALWPNITELISKRDYQSVKRYIIKYIPYGIYYIIVFTTLVAIFINKLMPLLVRNLEVTVPLSIIILFGLYYTIRVVSETFAMILQSASYLRPLWQALPFQAVLSIALQIFLADKFGLNGILIALIISFLLTVTWYFPYTTLKLMKNKK